MPTAPVHQGCAASQAITSSASSCSCGRYSSSEHALGVAGAAQVDPHARVAVARRSSGGAARRPAAVRRSCGTGCTRGSPARASRPASSGSHIRAASGSRRASGIHTWRTTRTASGSSRTILISLPRSIWGPAGPRAPYWQISAGANPRGARREPQMPAPRCTPLAQPEGGREGRRALRDGAAARRQELELEPPRAGEVLVRMVASGVCHSDLHVVEARAPRPMPAVIGHEGAGVVEEVGAGVGNVAVGDHVILTLAALLRRVPPVPARPREPLRAARVVGLRNDDGRHRAPPPRGHRHPPLHDVLVRRAGRGAGADRDQGATTTSR